MKSACYGRYQTYTLNRPEVDSSSPNSTLPGRDLGVLVRVTRRPAPRPTQRDVTLATRRAGPDDRHVPDSADHDKGVITWGETVRLPV